MAILILPRRWIGAAGARMLVGAAAALFSAVAPLAAGGQTAPEFAVKAAFLSKFGLFVDWPSQAFASASSSFGICLVGEDPFGPALDQAIRGQTVGGRAIVVRRLRTVARNAPCQVLFVGRDSDQGAGEVLRRLKGEPVLTVTDERAGTSGGTIHFIIRQGRVRFGIDAASAQVAGLGLSSKLLGLAVPMQKAGL